MDSNHEVSGELAGIVKKFADSGVRLQIGKKPQSIGFVGGISKPALSANSTKPQPSDFIDPEA